jgi:hypothetical protein
VNTRNAQTHIAGLLWVFIRPCVATITTKHASDADQIEAQFERVTHTTPDNVGCQPRASC